jgi:hypothetical protein
MLHPLSYVTLAVAAALLATWVRHFARKQNAGALGGGISSAKAAWLFFTVFTWFVVCPVLAADPAVPRGLRITLGAFAVWMWIRGGVEMYMLYVSRNWRPPLGIAHDLSCVALILALLARQGQLLSASSPLDRWVLVFVALVLVSLLVEILYAALFFRAARGNTTGQHGIWFADDHDPAFGRINRLTFALNVPLYLSLACFLLATYFA